MPGDGNLFDPAPPSSDAAERFDLLYAAAGTRVERIVSHAQASAPGFWYDQPDDEWVALLRGEARLAFEDGRQVALRSGDWLTIPAHCRHRVEATSADALWLAVHVPAAGAAR